MPIQGKQELGAELARIRKGDGKPIYLVHGAEHFLVRTAADSIARALADAAGAEIVRIDGTGLGPDAVLEPVVSLSLFASARVALVRNFASILTGDDADRLLASLDTGLGPGRAIVFVAAGENPADRVDKRVRGYKGLASRGVVLEFDEQKAEDLAAWLVEKAVEEGKKLDADAARLLLARAGTNMEALRTELDKAILFCLERDRIRAKDLERLVGKTKEDAVWDVGEAVARGDGSAACELVRDLEASGTHPLVVLTLLVRQARHLLQARLLWEEAGRPAFRDYRAFQSRVASGWDAGLFGKGSDDVTAIHPFASFKRFEAARGPDLAGLRWSLGRLRQAEVDIKTGAAEDAAEVVEGLVLELAARARRAA
ncbi:MAG: DNA polymerase III subunit delta [bacterium]